MKFQVLNRKVHYWASIFVALPLVVIIVTGILLQFKKQLPWVQPTEQRGRGQEPSLTLAQVLDICRGIPEAEIQRWEDINRIDVRPSKGMLKVRVKNNWEIQIDTQSGEVLQVAYRRSDLIGALHDGSWFHDGVKYGLFVPAALVLLLLWFTGLYLFVLPYLGRTRRQLPAAASQGRPKAPPRSEGDDQTKPR